MAEEEDEGVAEKEAVVAVVSSHRHTTRWGLEEVQSKGRPSYEAICEKDIRDWGDEDLTEIYLRGIRDQIIRDRYTRKL